MTITKMDHPLPDCETCAATKLHKTPFQESQRTTKRPLELVHSDIYGPINPPSRFDNHKWVINFVDQHTKLIRVYTMKRKSDALEMFQQYLADVNAKDLGGVATLRSDNGGEYISNDFKKFCRENGIKQEHTITNTPEQNGVAERNWRTMREMTAAMLKGANAKPYWWARAIKTAAYVRNRTYVKAIGMTPYEAFTGKKPDLDHLRIFGSRLYVYNDAKDRQKLDDRGLEGILVGYGENVKGYIIYVPSQNKLKYSRNVKFLEKNPQPLETPKEPEPSNQNDSTTVEITITDEDEDSLEPNQLEPEAATDDDEEEPFFNNLPQIDLNDPNPTPTQSAPSSPVIPPPPPPTANPTPLKPQKSANNKNKQPKELKRSNRNRRAPKRFGYFANIAHEMSDGAYHELHEQTPKTYQEAAEKPEWMKAVLDEFYALERNQVWEEVELPPGRNVIECKWCFKAKQDAFGFVIKKKARLVAKGYTQIHGIDFTETFAPVAKFTVIRLLLALARKYRWKVKLVDIGNAYLNAPIEEEIYMELPEGFKKVGKNGKPIVVRLRKALYGLKQAGRNWNQFLDKWLKEHGFIPSSVEPCLYICRKADGRILILAVYVDDILSAGDDSLREELLREMEKTFVISDMGDATWVLGTHIDYSDDITSIDQEKYLFDILNKFGMMDCNTATTPAVPRDHSNEDSALFEDKDQYLSLVGSLIYLSVVSRPDIAYAVGKAGQAMSNPTQEDWTAAKRILRYLKENPKLGPCYSSDGNSELIGYSDSDWGGDQKTRKSTSGYVFIYAGAAISWSSKKQATVALSSTEAEYIAACSAAQEAIYLRALLKDMGEEQTGPTIIFQDNQGTISMEHNKVSNKRTKHIDIKYHYIREMVDRKQISTTYVPTEKMIADCLTKPATKNSLDRALPILFGTTSKVMKLREGVDKPIP